jgi:DNA transformation protein
MSDRFDDLFAEFGPIRLRRFFGGEGIVADDVMIGMVFDDVIYFKTDDETRRSFVAEKTKPFSFLKRSTGETIVTTWFALPDRLYDDPEELAQWARAALAVARKAEAGKRNPAATKKVMKTKAVKKKPKKIAARKPAKKKRP